MASVYEANSSALTRRAFRYLQDQQQAEDVVQEAFIKVLLAAPELNDAEHLIAYLNKTVTNLCLDIRRSQNRGPLLVAVDSETSADLIDDLSHEQHVELDDALTQAEDAAIVREAISRLSETDRAVLLSIHLENKTTAETAAQFGVTEGTVRNALMRARRNLRTVLDEWVIDEATGMTATQYLSRTGQKIAENSKKIGSAALSLVLLVAAFFGFWNNPTTPVQVAATPKVTTEAPVVTASPATPAVEEDDEAAALIALLQDQIGALTGIASALGSIEISMPKIPTPTTTTELFAKAGAPVSLTEGFALTGAATALDSAQVIQYIDNDGSLRAVFTVATDKGYLNIDQRIARNGAVLDFTVTPNGATESQVIAVSTAKGESGNQINFTLITKQQVLPGLDAPQGYGITLVLNSDATRVFAETVHVAAIAPVWVEGLTNTILVVTQ